jgi:hypothetical protein
MAYVCFVELFIVVYFNDLGVSSLKVAIASKHEGAGVYIGCNIVNLLVLPVL